MSKCIVCEKKAPNEAIAYTFWKYINGTFLCSECRDRINDVVVRKHNEAYLNDPIYIESFNEVKEMYQKMGNDKCS